jgi:hypothetical protein
MGRNRRNKYKNQFFTSMLQNSVSWQYYYNRLKEIAISCIEWKNLPDTVDARFLELTLFEDGAGVYFNDDVLGNLFLQATLDGRLNVYREPIKTKAHAVNGYSKYLNETNSVIIHNNMLHTNSVKACKMFAMRLANIDRTIDVNINAQKTPVLIKSGENERLSMVNLYQQYDGGMPFIFGSDQLNTDNITALRTDAPFVAPQLYELKTNIWNEALTYLGISNVNITKRERLVSDEVNRSQGGSIASKFSRLHERQVAVEKINKMFGTNISVNYREELDTSLVGLNVSRETLQKGDIVDE